MRKAKICPRCYTRLELKKSRATNREYLVCPNYPDCRRPIELRKPPVPTRLLHYRQVAA